MPRLGVVEKEEVKSLILVCRARGYNSKQILSIVNDNLKKYNNSISEKAIFNILAKTKKDAQEWLKNLSVGKDNYIDEYRQRIMELNEQRRDLWEVVRKYESQPFVQIAAHKEIHALTKSILQLYETLPLILNNNSNNNKLSDIIYEDTTSLYPEVSI
ncbi:MAG TPA: hypothetical protein VH500_14295 [Nitrososphaeraceae archaeon]|jgi:hypothetical protein